VSTLIAERFPATLELALVAARDRAAGGHSAGRVCGAAARPAVAADDDLSLLGVSLPTFLIGILLILVFAVT
jgi:peptide/nickel transport system permease protein